MNGRRARSIIGTPRMGRNCFGSPGPARTPDPAATRTTPTSGGEAAGEVTDVIDPYDLETARDPGARGEKHAPESLAFGFDETAFRPRDGPDFAAETDFPEEQRVGGQRAIVHARDQGRQHGEIGGGFEQPHAPGHVDEDVEAADRSAAAPFQNGERSEEHTSELQSLAYLVCRLLL